MDIPDAELLAAFHRVPRPIREFASSEELGTIGATLAQKYKLHVDATGTLADILTKALLGFIRPEEMTKILMDALLLEQSVASALIADINASVFMPLQKKVREALELEQEEKELEQESTRVEKPVAPVQPVPAKPAPLPPPALEYVPAAPTLPGSPVAAPMPVAAVVVPEPAPQVSLEPTIAQQPAPQQHIVHAMPHSSPQPGWHPAAAVHIFVPTHAAPQQQAHSLPTEQPAVPQTPVLPEAPKIPAPSQETVAEPIISVNPAPNSEVPLTKSYAADPYRESI